MISVYQPAMYRSAPAGNSAPFTTAAYHPGSGSLLRRASFADYDVDAVDPGQQQTATPAPAPGQTSTPQRAGPLTQQPASNGEVYGPYVPYVPPAPAAVQLGSTPPVSNIPQPQVTDVLPTARYVPNAPATNGKTRGRNAANPDVAAGSSSSGPSTSRIGSRCAQWRKPSAGRDVQHGSGSRGAIQPGAGCFSGRAARYATGKYAAVWGRHSRPVTATASSIRSPTRSRAQSLTIARQSVAGGRPLRPRLRNPPFRLRSLCIRA